MAEAKKVKSGLDYSWGRPSPAAIVAAGQEFVIRYAPYRGDQGKGLSRPELDALRAARREVGLVFESTAGRMFDGRPAGVQDAITAQLGVEALRMPDTVAIFFACDVDVVNDDQLALVQDYLEGVADVITVSRIGIYGDYDAIERCINQGLATYFWQAAARFWSNNRLHPYRHILQTRTGQMLDGAEVDFNEAYGEDQGLWGFEENEVKQDDFDDLVLATFAGSEQRYPETDDIPEEKRGQTMPRAERLEIARFRMMERANGEAQSVSQDANEDAGGEPPVGWLEHQHKGTATGGGFFPD